MGKFGVHEFLQFVSCTHRFYADYSELQCHCIVYTEATRIILARWGSRYDSMSYTETARFANYTDRA